MAKSKTSACAAACPILSALFSIRISHASISCLFDSYLNACCSLWERKFLGSLWKINELIDFWCFHLNFCVIYRVKALSDIIKYRYWECAGRTVRKHVGYIFDLIDWPWGVNFPIKLYDFSPFLNERVQQLKNILKIASFVREIFYPHVPSQYKINSLKRINKPLCVAEHSNELRFSLHNAIRCVVPLLTKSRN